MALAIPVKLSRVTNLSDARYGAGMGVQLMGFCMSPTNPHRISPEEFSAITGWLSGPEFVGEFDPETPLSIITETAREQDVHWVEIHDTNLVAPLKEQGFHVILVAEWNAIALPDTSPDYLLIYSDAEEFTVGEKLGQLKEINREVPLLLGSGLVADQIRDWQKASALTGVAVAGGDEIRPGYKDFDEIADILEALEVDD
jgi:phosphoribosylanthranilate isomerase